MSLNSYDLGYKQAALNDENLDTEHYDVNITFNLIVLYELCSPLQEVIVTGVAVNNLLISNYIMCHLQNMNVAHQCMYNSYNAITCNDTLHQP